MDLFRLDGKTALITGGSRGIGRAIALRMTEAGANVVVASRRKEACDEVVAEIEARGAADSLFLAMCRKSINSLIWSRKHG